MERPVARTPRPSMLTADEVAERLKIKKGSAYEVIRQMNKEQEALGRMVIRGRVRSDLFEARYFPEVDDASHKDKKTGLFYVQFYYRDARGAKRHKTKKGFQTELEALLWEKNFKALKDDAMDMTFADFCNVYEAEVRPRVREHTWLTKENII